jgi:hypothetical protein
MDQREFAAQLRADGTRKSNCSSWSLAPARAGTDIFSRSGAWSSRARFSLPKIAIRSLTALGKSLPLLRANCTMNLSAHMARASL